MAKKQGFDVFVSDMSAIKDKYKDLLDKFFDEKYAYNYKQLSDHLQIDEKETKKLLREYADLELGIKIRDCIKENGECSFSAEM